MNHAEKEAHMPLKPFQAFALPLRLAVAHADERQYRRRIHHGQRSRIFHPNFTDGNQHAENAGMIIQNAFHITPGIQCRQLRRAELFDGHHTPKTADGCAVKRILELVLSGQLEPIFSQPLSIEKAIRRILSFILVNAVTDIHVVYSDPRASGAKNIKSIKLRHVIEKFLLTLVQSCDIMRVQRKMLFC